MLSVSFYRPVEYFSGTFNRFVTWMTAGEFCHCELVIHSTPDQIMSAVKHVYTAAQQGQYPPEDCNRIIGQIEQYFFDPHFKAAAQSQDKMSIAFSLLWGHPMSVRVLQETAHDSWFKMPTKLDKFASVVDIPNIEEGKLVETLRFSIGELGKNYDSSGALFSWLPFSSEHKSSYESYFCSEFVVTALQRIHLYESMDALHTTPNSLYGMISI